MAISVAQLDKSFDGPTQFIASTEKEISMAAERINNYKRPIDMRLSNIFYNSSESILVSHEVVRTVIPDENTECHSSSLCFSGVTH